jgi:hypothetical protein
MRRLFQLCLLLGYVGAASAAQTADVCVYGGTAGGIAAALQAAHMGKSVWLVEPARHLGGLSTGGLGATDIGNKAAIGGIAREFYHRIALYYSQDSAWTFETREEYLARRRGSQTQAADLPGPDATMWTFEPHVAEAVFNQMLTEAHVQIALEQTVRAVRKDGARLMALVTDRGTVFEAAMFIDASYEGELMANAGVSYFVGREPNSRYGETLDGIRRQTPKHQFAVPVDPFLKPGDPKSGLVPFVQAEQFGEPGAGDRCVQAYNFRLCFTTNPVNRLPLEPPADYKPERYELLARYLEALIAAGKHPVLAEFWNPIWMPNGKTDINNNGGFSTDYIGASYQYPEGDAAARDRIRSEHEVYTRGFLAFLATSPRVPDNIRTEMRLWGPCRDEFTDTGGWPRQLYVREARRMVSEYVMTEKNCRGDVKAEDAVGLGAYNMDSHNCRRIVRQGKVENEGDVQESVRPYPIAYRSLVPKVAECSNLVVPVCLSASHIAYGSIRMEPVFMILGQSSATAVCLAIDLKRTVQEVPYTVLRERLLADRQVLDWSSGN